MSTSTLLTDIHNSQAAAGSLSSTKHNHLNNNTIPTTSSYGGTIFSDKISSRATPSPLTGSSSSSSNTTTATSSSSSIAVPVTPSPLSNAIVAEPPSSSTSPSVSRVVTKESLTSDVANSIFSVPSPLDEGHYYQQHYSNNNATTHCNGNTTGSTDNTITIKNNSDNYKDDKQSISSPFEFSAPQHTFQFQSQEVVEYSHVNGQLEEQQEQQQHQEQQADTDIIKDEADDSLFFETLHRFAQEFPDSDSEDQENNNNNSHGHSHGQQGQEQGGGESVPDPLLASIDYEYNFSHSNGNKSTTTLSFADLVDQSLSSSSSFKQQQQQQQPRPQPALPILVPPWTTTKTAKKAKTAKQRKHKSVNKSTSAANRRSKPYSTSSSIVTARLRMSTVTNNNSTSGSSSSTAAPSPLHLAPSPLSPPPNSATGNTSTTSIPPNPPLPSGQPAIMSKPPQPQVQVQPQQPPMARTAMPPPAPHASLKLPPVVKSSIPTPIHHHKTLPPPPPQQQQQQPAPSSNINTTTTPAMHHSHAMHPVHHPPHNIPHHHPPPMMSLPPISIPASSPMSSNNSNPEPATPTSTSSSNNNSNNNNNNNNNLINPNISENTGRWTAEEHRLFLQGLEQHGKGWKKIAGLIKSRTVVQIRTHAQKYFQKLAKARQNGEAGVVVGGGIVGSVVGGVVVGGGGGGIGNNINGGNVNHAMADGTPANNGVNNPASGAGGVTMSTVDGYSITSSADGIGSKTSMGMAIIPAGSRGAGAGSGGNNSMSLQHGGGGHAHAVHGHAHHHHPPYGHGHHQGTNTTAAAANGGNMSLGTDPTSMAAAAGIIGIASNVPEGTPKKRRSVPNGTKRRAIGSVVRSAVREGRNVKRQKIAEGKRGAAANAAASASSNSSSSSLGGDNDVANAGNNGKQSLQQSSSSASTKITENNGTTTRVVPNPLPSVSSILDPYVNAAVAAHQHQHNLAAGNNNNNKGGKNNNNNNVNSATGAAAGTGRGRNQMIHTATHGKLPMAALEDAVFRLLTPATGAPAPPLPPGSSVTPPAIMDPLAPHQVKIPMTHAQYGVPNSSPTCVTDMSSFPSWVDTKNPPQWYNDGADIDKLLEDADLNWLEDTGDLDDNYPGPHMEMDFSVDPTCISSNGEDAILQSASSCADTPSLLSTDGTTTTDVEPIAIKMEDVGMQMQHPTMEVHPSADSLSFLVDEGEEGSEHLPLPGMASFMDASDSPGNDAVANMSVPFASATEAIEAHGQDNDKLNSSDSHAGLMGFPDLDMGDEQAFVSALLENSGQSSISFPKLHSDLGVHVNNGQSGVGLSGVSSNALVEGQPEDEM